MKNILTSWLFFTSLTILLLVSAYVLPELLHGVFGETEAAALQMESEIRAVWAQFHP